MDTALNIFPSERLCIHGNHGLNVNIDLEALNERHVLKPYVDKYESFCHGISTYGFCRKICMDIV